MHCFIWESNRDLRLQKLYKVAHRGGGENSLSFDRNVFLEQTRCDSTRPFPLRTLDYDLCALHMAQCYQKSLIISVDIAASNINTVHL